MTTLYLIRHGKVEDASFIYGRTEMALSNEGHNQLFKLGHYLHAKGIVPSAIIASRLKRTWQSAEEIRKSYSPKLPIIPSDDLLEVDFGEVEGRRVKFFYEVGGDLFTHNVEGLPRANETPQQLVDRMSHAFDTIQKNYPDQTVFVVSHGDPLSFKLWRLLHPEGDLQTAPKIYKETAYLDKGDCARIVLDDEGKLVEHEIIRIEDVISGEFEGKPSRERE